MRAFVSIGDRLLTCVCVFDVLVSFAPIRTSHLISSPLPSGSTSDGVAVPAHASPPMVMGAARSTGPTTGPN